MRIPRYWQKAGGPVTTPRGATWHLECWGWSDESEAVAAGVAQGLLKAQAEAIAAGRAAHETYGYHDRPLREEILERPGSGMVVTRNRYGARVLNTEQVAFVDVDLDLRGPQQPGFFARLFGARPEPGRAVDDQLQVLEAALKGFASARVYRTAAGLRLLLTDRLHVPNAPETLQLLEGLGSDPLYRTLCREQECFRARLTPKPWRCDQPVLESRWPYPNPEVVRRWVERYEAASTGFAATQYLTHFGDSNMPDEVRAVVEVHDRLSGATSGLPLA